LFQADQFFLMRILTFLLVFFVAQVGVLMGQDPIFTQFHAVPVRMNPAFAGSAFAPRMALGYRNQWPGFGNAYQTYTAYYEQQIERYNSGVGISFEGDNAGNGLRKSTAVSGLYSYRVAINRNADLKFGAEVGMHQIALDWSKFIFTEQIGPDGNIIGITPDNFSGPDSRRVLDVSAGVLLTSEKFYVGSSFKHITSPRINFTEANDNLKTGLPIRFVAQAGMMIMLNKPTKQKDMSFVSPNVLISSQGPFQQINVGGYAGIGPVFGGLWYRHTLNNHDAVNLLLGVREGVFKIGLSYDATVSRLAPIAGGAFEATIGIELDRDPTLKQRRKNKQLNDCLHMFY
jgi:type IX secretion system PorP/SprF family membrane protein